MKKIATVLILILLIISCNHKNKGLINPQDSDSIIRVEKRNQEIQDSLNQIRTDSLSLIAWGDAKFGMSIKEVLATESFKTDTNIPPRTLIQFLWILIKYGS